jgi:hypothetical protein
MNLSMMQRRPVDLILQKAALGRVKSTRSLKLSSLRNTRGRGWYSGAIVIATLFGIVFLVNLSLAIWATAAHSTPNGIGTFFEGHCGKTGSWSKWSHFAINVLSSVLLTGSNYCM